MVSIFSTVPHCGPWPGTCYQYFKHYRNQKLSRARILIAIKLKSLCKWLCSGAEMRDSCIFGQAVGRGASRRGGGCAEGVDSNFFDSLALSPPARQLLTSF